MAKRKKSGFEVASMPWPVGIMIGLLGYMAIRYGIAWYFGGTDNPYLSGLSGAATAGITAPLGWLLLVCCWIAAIASFIGRAQRRKLLDAQTGIDSLRHMSWRQFEQLAGEAFRRQGYMTEETGLGGADGGIDLILRKDGQTTLVQCKHWQNRQVGVSVIREMYGLLMHHRASAVKIVALGNYTTEAHHFAQGKPIELVHGGELIATVRSLQTTKSRPIRPLDTSLALAGSMMVSLLAIAGLSIITAAPHATATTPLAAQTARSMPQPASMAASKPAPVTMRHTPPQPSHPRASIYASNPQNDPTLREWTKRNAESMKMLEKTTKEMPLRQR
jgi:restriction system protein